MILILGGPGDESANSVQSHLQRRMYPVARFDPDGFSGVGAVSLALGGAGRLDGVLSPGGREVYVEDISAVWFGRPGRFAANPILEDLWDVLDAPMLPGTFNAQQLAMHAVRQQRAAQEAGFEVSAGEVRPQMRVVVVGEKVFAVAVTASTTPTPIAAYALPPNDALKCKTLVNALDLKYASIDFATMPENRLMFVRLDPHGHFDDIESLTNMPISRAVADMLVNNTQATSTTDQHLALANASPKHSFFTAARLRHPSMHRARKGLVR